MSDVRADVLRWGPMTSAEASPATPTDALQHSSRNRLTQNDLSLLTVRDGAVEFSFQQLASQFLNVLLIEIRGNRIVIFVLMPEV